MKKVTERCVLSLGLLLAGCSIASVAYGQSAFELNPAEGGAKPASPPKKAPPKPVAKPAPKPAEPAKPAAAAAPQTNVARFGAWAVSCAQKKAATDPANCIALISVARDKDDQRRIVIMGVVKREGTMSYFAQTPTTVSMKPGVDIQFEGRAPRHFEYDSCEPALCTVTKPLDDALAEEILATPNATITWTSLAAGAVKVVFPTNGAREAIDFLKAQ